MDIETFERIRIGDRGVSPVIGVVLMIAVTVILTGVIAAFVMSFGAQAKAPPQATLSIEETTDGVTISHLSGEVLELDELYVRGGGENVRLSDPALDTAALVDNQTLRGGESITIPTSRLSPDIGDELTLVWDDGNDATILVTHTWVGEQ